LSAILITDGECAFCQRTAKKLAGIVQAGWVNVPSTELTNTYSIRYSGAKAVGKVLRLRGGLWGALGWLTFIPPASWIAAGMYRLVANNRKFFSRFV